MESAEAADVISILLLFLNESQHQRQLKLNSGLLSDKNCRFQSGSDSCTAPVQKLPELQ